jgi:hypothetical protein
MSEERRPTLLPQGRRPSIAGPTPGKILVLFRDDRYRLIAPIAHLGATDLDRPDPSLDRAIRPVAVTHDAVATIRQLQIFPHGHEAYRLSGRFWQALTPASIRRLLAIVVTQIPV